MNQRFILTFVHMGVIGVIVASGVVLPACKSHQGSYQTPPDSARDPGKAQRLNQEASKLLSKEPARAERLLRDALAADLFFGPAHNNLGVVYLNQGKLYEAAEEFEWARKLMPGHPDPRVNLAAVLERAGRTDEALANYESALDAAPECIAAIQGLTRLQVRAGRRDNRTRSLLEEVALRGEDPRWRAWARQQLAEGATP